MKNAFRAAIENAVEIFVAVAMRLRVFDDHVMIGKLVALREIKPVEHALDTFAREVRADIVPRKFRAGGNRMRNEIRAAAKMRVQRRHVKRFVALVLKLAVLHVRAVRHDYFRDHIRKTRRVRDAAVTFEHDEPAVFFRDNQIARMSRRARFFARGNEEQMNRLGERDVRGNVNKRAVLKNARFSALNALSAAVA